MRARRLASSLLALTSLLAACSAVGCAADVPDTEAARSEVNAVSGPPQYVLLAFDGSLNNDFWTESRAFAKKADVKFTYFISGVYFVPNAKKSAYVGPHGFGAGKSAIGFGGESAAIATRFRHLQGAFDEGHEIASHANGHFDGSSWSEADWKSEFDQFDEIVFGGVGGMTPGLTFGAKTSVGFRAPQLGHSPGLFRAMAKHDYAYDTSKTAAANFWPRKESGIWNFPLAQLRIVGSGKATLSMDYNFYVADSKGLPNAAGKATFKRQMLDTYAKYFESNYFGNRAPVHIGHHFSKWNGGAYWEAMQEFSERVCGLPEVKCVTYKELLSFVETNQQNLPAYQAGNFTKMPRPPGAEGDASFAPFSDEELAEVLAARESHDGDDDE